MEFPRTRYVFVHFGVLLMLSLWVNCTVADDDFLVCNYRYCVIGCDQRCIHVIRFVDCCAHASGEEIM